MTDRHIAVETEHPNERAQRRSEGVGEYQSLKIACGFPLSEAAKRDGGGWEWLGFGLKLETLSLPESVCPACVEELLFRENRYVLFRVASALRDAAEQYAQEGRHHIPGLSAIFANAADLLERPRDPKEPK